MRDEFELFEPEDAEHFLASFDQATRQKGDAYLADGRVGQFTCKNPGRTYSVEVRGTDVYNVALSYDEKEGWIGGCTCPLQYDCKHIYAALKALIVEDRAARVRNLSAGIRSTATVAAARQRVHTPTGTFAEYVVTTLNRKLTAPEAKFLRRLKEVYDRCVTRRQINRSDFIDLGLSLGGQAWETLEIWPVFPVSEHQFWLYVALAAHEHNVTLPKFLADITELGPVRDELARWRRDREVDRWRQVLTNVKAGANDPSLHPRAEYDLRLCLDETCAELQWLQPGREQFEPVKLNLYRNFVAEREEGHATLPAEAELLFEFFQQRARAGQALQLNYREPAALRLLSRIFRLPPLESRLVTTQGRPFVRTTDPLRWTLIPAEDETDNYRFRLTRADGSPPPPILCVLPGQPALFLSQDAVYVGPSLAESVLDPLHETLIPAPAIECREGAEFLRGIGVEFPERLRERVRHVAMQVMIRCDLQPMPYSPKSEECLIEILAQSDDGQHSERWNGDDWEETSEPTPKKPRRKEDVLTIYDRSAMSLFPRLLEPLGAKWAPYSNSFFLRVTKKFPELFTAWLRTVPPSIAVKLGGELASLAQSAVTGNVRLDVTETSTDWFDLRVVLDVKDTTLTPDELKLLLAAKGGFVRLQGKGWRRLQFDLSSDDDEKLARLGLSARELSDEPQRLHALQLADDAAKRFLPAAQVEQLQRRASEIQTRVTPDLPTGVLGELRPYQREGFHFLAYLATNRFGGILADDMGLGKTLQALVWLAWLRESSRTANAGGNPPPSLVVCPKSVTDNWHAEATRFTPGLRVKVWSASEIDSFHNRLYDADLHVINYNQLRIVGEALAPVRWLAVILDEGQYIKNPSSQTAQVARALHADYRLALSGTPIENKLLDLWSLMAFVMPGVLGSRNGFGRLFDSKEDPFARRRLAARVRPFLLRRTKGQVAKDLPDRVEEDLFCDIEGEQKTLYRAELKRAQQMLLRIQTQKQFAEERFHVLTSLLRLRQICCHPALLKAGSKAPSAKVEALLEQLEPLMEEGHKVLVFSQFVEMLQILRKELADKGWPLFYLAGDTENRGELVRNFQAAQGSAVFLISLKAGGFGLNLTAASYVVLFDPWWNPAVENQAIDRTHRIGQTRNVIAYRLLIKDSIEEKIRALQKTKSALADDVLGEEKFAQSLSLSDLQFLFSDT